MKKNLCLPLLLTGLISACSSNAVLEKPLDYQSDAPVQQGKLELPPDLTAPQIQNRYQLPGNGSASLIDYSKTGNSPAQIQQDSNLLVKPANAHIERGGTQRWLVVDNKAPEQVWPLLKAFWQDNGFVIKSEEPDIGLMETDWAENRAKLGMDPVRRMLDTVGLGGIMSTPERDKFRIRLERTSNGTEVYFTHRGMYETYINEGKSETKWQPRPADPELETEFLARFMVRLGHTEDQAKTSAKAVENQPSTVEKTQIQAGTLLVNDGFDRAWRRVGLALDRIGLQIVDRDRSQGIYYVRPAKGDVDAQTGKTEGGFWSGLAFWRDKNEAIQQEEQYRVTVQADGTQTKIQLQSKDGKPLAETLATQIARKLAEQLK
ncbi:outer membrane protein assembly factor BamC [Craterilacuibacter sinensis]|uniref:Outer membrane protein assembly factor BamC n=1 Tax=Craterilacuibacter sinensis TaxID=2686017 RepID=A0A845BP01_9NEIS|nr:outer membrane protein assembly factor BamC [Craterilacuibacter sinensis]MXR38172.1 outer membrane protein assembly factor BamC [Craterilacuibacter sinensis]RQW24217.1 outer membrane protein assembly factor BamC [Rhodobacteraceae bacterium CH30]